MIHGARSNKRRRNLVIAICGVLQGYARGVKCRLQRNCFYTVLVYCDCGFSGKPLLYCRYRVLPLRGFRAFTAGASRFWASTLAYKYTTMTDWRTYTIVQPLEGDEIQFESLGSVAPAVGTSTATGRLLTQETTALVFKGFAITGVVNTIELRLRVSRLARIQDKTIQLWIGGEAWGENLADLSAEDEWVYTWTGLDHEWGAEDGVVIDLQPHRQYPSSNTICIRSVQLRAL